MFMTSYWYLNTGLLDMQNFIKFRASPFCTKSVDAGEKKIGKDTSTQREVFNTSSLFYSSRSARFPMQTTRTLSKWINRMENIAEIKDKVTCLNLIWFFFISEFLALESSGSWESKEEGNVSANHLFVGGNSAVFEKQSGLPAGGSGLESLPISRKRARYSCIT